MAHIKPRKSKQALSASELNILIGCEKAKQGQVFTQIFREHYWLTDNN